MIFPLAYIEFLTHFHGDRDFFECHEVLEDHWKKCGTEKDSVWVGLIQIAVSLYHYRRGNKKGAVKLMEKAIGILDRKKAAVHSLGLNHEQLLKILDSSWRNMRCNAPYKAIALPIQDSELLAVCKDRVRAQGYEWNSEGDHLNEYITNKHIARRKPFAKNDQRTAVN